MAGPSLHTSQSRSSSQNQDQASKVKAGPPPGTRRELPLGALPHLPSWHTNNPPPGTSGSQRSATSSAMDISRLPVEESPRKRSTNPRGRLAACLPDEARLRYQMVMTTAGPCSLTMPTRHSLESRLAGATSSGSCTPQLPVVFKSFQFSGNSEFPSMPLRKRKPAWTGGSLSLRSDLGSGSLGSATRRTTDTQSMFGSQVDSRKPTSQRYNFSPLPHQESTYRICRFANKQFYGKQILDYVNLGQEGQGPATYSVGATVAAKQISSTKPNVPKFGFGTSSRWGINTNNHNPSFFPHGADEALGKGMLTYPGPSDYSY